MLRIVITLNYFWRYHSTHCEVSSMLDCRQNNFRLSPKSQISTSVSDQDTAWSPGSRTFDSQFWGFITETVGVFTDDSWLFCSALRDLVMFVVKGAKQRIFASLAALYWETVAMKDPSTNSNKVPDWAGSVGGLCKACYALQNSANSLKILFHHPTAWLDRDGSFLWGCFIIHESLIANGHLLCLCR